jgi:hypothetical protein
MQESHCVVCRGLRGLKKGESVTSTCLQKAAYVETKKDELARSQEMTFPVIPAKVPRQARDPELVERAGI